MKWTKFKIETNTASEDILIAALYEIGLEGALIEDNIPLSEEEKAGMFVDIPPETGEDDGNAILSFFVEKNEDGSLNIAGDSYSIPVMLDRIREVLSGLKENTDIGSGRITIDETEDIDWVNNWKEYFHQFTIGDLLVIPSWEEPGEGNEKCTHRLRIDPGTAFGTGSHETTSLVIRQLQKYVKKGDTVLDVGTGSGILSIVALMYGAESALGTDLDPCCREAVAQNLSANNIPESSMRLVLGNIIDDPQIQKIPGDASCDIVTANILSEVLVDLTPVIPRFLKQGGMYITSGILIEKISMVSAAIEKAGLTVSEITEDGEWACITATKA